MTLRLAALAWIFLAALPARAAGVTFTMEGQGHKSTIWIEGSHLRIEEVQADKPSRVLIFNAATKTLMLVDSGEKTYTVMNEADLREMGAQINDQMEKAMAKMPPDQQAKMREMMAARGIGPPGKDPPPEKKHDVSFKATGAKQEVAGHACQDYKVSVDGEVHEEICAIPWSSSVVTRADLDAFVKFGDFASKGFGGHRSDGAGTQAFQDMITKAPGFPAIRMQLDQSGARAPGEKMVAFKRGSIPADMFAVPSGFNKVAHPVPGSPPSGAHPMGAPPGGAPPMAAPPPTPAP